MRRLLLLALVLAVLGVAVWVLSKPWSGLAPAERPSTEVGEAPLRSEEARLEGRPGAGTPDASAKSAREEESTDVPRIAIIGRVIDDMRGDGIPGVLNDIELQRPRFDIRGHLVTESEIPVEGLEVDAWWQGVDDDDYGKASAEADATGEFVIRGVSDGAKTQLRVVRPTQRGLFAEKRHVEAMAGDAGVVIRLLEGLTISGRLAGPGIDDIDFPSLMVVAWGLKQGMGGAGGRPPKSGAVDFEIRGLRPGLYGVNLHDRRNGPLRHLASVKGVEAGRTHVVLHLPRRDGVIEGVVDLTLLPKGAVVDVWAWGQSENLGAKRSTCDAQGAFRFDDLRRGMEFTLVLAVHDDERLLRLDFVAMLEGVELGQGVRLVPEAGLWIQGRLRGGLARCPRIKATAGREWIQGSVGEEGAFRIGPLVRGRYRIEVRPHKVSVDGIDAGAKDVVIDLE